MRKLILLPFLLFAACLLVLDTYFKRLRLFGYKTIKF